MVSYYCSLKVFWIRKKKKRKAPSPERIATSFFVLRICWQLFKNKKGMSKVNEMMFKNEWFDYEHQSINGNDKELLMQELFMH